MPKPKKKATPILDNELERISPTQENNSSTPLPKLKLSLRLVHGDEIAMGPGKADLLTAIAKTGSISAAGKSMGMSYRRAWMLVDVMNRCFKSPLVETAKGGSHGGGAWLSPLGKAVLANYQIIDAATKQVAQAHLGLFEDCMAEEISVFSKPVDESDQSS